jgi:hypothetical protein
MQNPSTNPDCKTSALLSLLFFGLCYASEKQLDKNKYIGIDEIRPGMDAYCLTVYEGTKVEQFDMEVVDVMRDFKPGQDLILVKGTDERFIYTGPVSGCSGSPVYIESRLAGALALAVGWPFSKDALYGATPIEEMLAVTDHKGGRDNRARPVLALDFSKPIELAEIDKLLHAGYGQGINVPSGFTRLPVPLITSLPMEAITDFTEPFGFMAVPGVSGGGATEPTEEIKLTPGASLAISLSTGDIKITGLGTVTEVIDEKIYGLGHGFLSYGAVDLPLATGYVNTVVASNYRSFKLGDSLKTVGAIKVDEATGVYGEIGAKAELIPVELNIERYNDRRRILNCQLANNIELTPLLVRMVLKGVALMKGSLPPDHLMEYKVTIEIEGHKAITFENLSTAIGLNEFLTECVVPLAILLNNPYEKAQIQGIDIDICITEKNVLSNIWSVDLSDTHVKAGESLKISVVIESFLTQKKKYTFDFKIPENLEPGQYDLIIGGSSAYERFLRSTAPYKFKAQNFQGIIEALNNILNIRRDKLYSVLALPSAGVAIEESILPDLPASKALVLQDAKRTLRLTPYTPWIEKQLDIDSVIIDKEVFRITVE